MHCWRLRLFVLFCSISCQADDVPAARESFIAVNAAWTLYSPTTPDTFCQLPQFVALYPSLQKYQQTCPPKSVACLQWRYGYQRNDGTWRLAWPLGVISTYLEPDDYLAGEVHELIHAFIFCTNASPDDLFDRQHSIPQFWAVKNSVFASAMESLNATGTGVDAWHQHHVCSISLQVALPD